MTLPEALRGWTPTPFTPPAGDPGGSKTRTVYRRGSGPGVLIMHEVPGLHPDVVRFGNEVVNAGFTVFMPDLFGTPGRPVSTGYAMGQLARACVSREFHVLASHQSSPICHWLRALARAMHEELGGPGIGAVGMCLTGNFALSLMMEPALMAPVLSQPSLPLPLGAERRAALHVSPEELENVRRRAAEGCRVIGLRFSDDGSSPRERFETLEKELDDGFEWIEVPSSSVTDSINPTGPHSVLTGDLRDEEGHPTVEARDRVLAYFQERLLG